MNTESRVTRSRAKCTGEGGRPADEQVFDGHRHCSCDACTSSLDIQLALIPVRYHECRASHRHSIRTKGLQTSILAFKGNSRRRASARSDGPHPRQQSGMLHDASVFGNECLSLDADIKEGRSPLCLSRHVQGGHADEKAPVRKEVPITLASAKGADETDSTENLSKDKASADIDAGLTALHITEGPTAVDEATGDSPILLPSCILLRTTKYGHSRLELCFCDACKTLWARSTGAELLIGNGYQDNKLWHFARRVSLSARAMLQVMWRSVQGSTCCCRKVGDCSLTMRPGRLLCVPRSRRPPTLPSAP